MEPVQAQHQDQLQVLLVPELEQVPLPVLLSEPALLLMPLPVQPLLPLLGPGPAYSLEQQGRLYIPSH